MEFMLNDYELKRVQRYSPVWASEYDGNSSLLNWDGITINKKYTGIRYSANIVTSAMSTEETEELILELSKGCVDFQSVTCTGIVEFKDKVIISNYKKMPVKITDTDIYYEVSFDVVAVELLDARGVFNVTLCYGDNGENEIQHFSNIVIQRSFDTGIAISQLSFQTPAPFPAPFAAKITLGGVNCGVDYYISSRLLSNGSYSVNCVDRNAFLDELVELNEVQVKQDYLQTPDFMEQCRKYFGYSSIYGVPEWCAAIPVAEISGKTYRAVLQMIADAAYGVWVCDRGNVLRFVRKGYYTESFHIDEHTSLDVSAVPEITGIVMTDTEGNTQTRGYGDRNYKYLQFESSLYGANSYFIEEAITDVYNRMVLNKNNFGSDVIVDKSAMSCQRAILYEIPHTVCIICFSQYPYRYYECNSMNISITPIGIYASLSNNIDVNEIQTRGKIY